MNKYGNTNKIYVIHQLNADKQNYDDYKWIIKPNNKITCRLEKN